MLKKVLTYTTAFGLVAGLTTASFATDTAAGKPAAEAAGQDNKVNEFKEALGSLNIDLQNVKGDAVVARVGKKTFTANDVAEIMQQTLRAAQQSMGPDFVKTLTPEVLFLIAREQLIDLYLVDQEVEGNKERLLKDPAVQEQIAEATLRVLQEAMIKEKADAYVTKAKVAEKYKELSDQFPKDAEEAHVRMIVVKTEDDAKKVIDQLNSGGDFLKLAREQSIDKKSAANDGDLGYVNEITKESLLPGFDVIFAKKDGKYTIPTGSFSKTPIQSPMGYVILKVEDRRPVKKPKLSELEPVLKDFLRQEAVQKMQEELKKKAGNIERLHPNTGKPMKSLEDELKGIQEKLKAAGVAPEAKADVKAEAKAEAAKTEAKPEAKPEEKKK